MTPKQADYIFSLGLSVLCLLLFVTLILFMSEVF